MKKAPKIRVDESMPGINAYYQDDEVVLSYKAQQILSPTQLRALIRHELAHHYQWHSEIFTTFTLAWMISLLSIPSLFGLQWAGIGLGLWWLSNTTLELCLEICADWKTNPRDMLDVLEVIGADSWKVNARRVVLKGRIKCLNRYGKAGQ